MNNIPKFSKPASGVWCVSTPIYRWEYHEETDTFSVMDKSGRTVLTGPQQPVVEVADARGTFALEGHISEIAKEGSSLRLSYEDVNGESTIDQKITFTNSAIWMPAITYKTSQHEDIVRVHHFSKVLDAEVKPGLEHTQLVHPGISESPAVSPLLPTLLELDLTTWLGRGSMGDDSKIFQQWGLPAHYFGGATRNAFNNAANSVSKHMSDSFCCGLTRKWGLVCTLVARRGGLSSLTAGDHYCRWLRGCGEWH